MKREMMLLICLCPTLALAEDAKTYTNADLVEFQVPGSYTNEDLRKLPPLAVQDAPAARLPRFEIPRVDSAGFHVAYNHLKAVRANR